MMPLRQIAAIGLTICALFAGICTASGGELPARLAGHGGPVMAVEFSADGTEALTASFDYSVILWRMRGKTGEIVHRMQGHNAAVNDVAFVPGRRQAVSVSDDGSLAVWDLDSGTMITRMGGGAEKMVDVDVSSDGEYAAAARWDGTARLYDIVAGREISSFEGHRGNVNTVAFSPDGSTLYTGSYDGTVRSWPLKSGKAAGIPSIVYSHGWGINAIAATPDGSALLFGALNGAGGIIDLASTEVTKLEFGENPILSLALSPDGSRFAAGSANGNIWVVDLKTAAIIEEYDNIHGPVWGLAFTLDGKTLYHAGLDDFVTLWQIDPRKIVEPVETVFPRRFQVSEGDDPGNLEFQRKCSICHTLIPDGGNRAGPTLFGLFGRKAGSVDGYDYSPALANSDIIWNEKTVAELFEDGPDVMVPGTKMPIQVLKSVDRRDALISFLKKASAPVNDNLNAQPRKR